MLGEAYNAIIGVLLALFGFTTLIGALAGIYDHRVNEAGKAAALAAGPPAAAPIERFDPKRDLGVHGEVALLARAIPAAAEAPIGRGSGGLLALQPDDPAEETTRGFAVHPLRALAPAPLPTADAAAFPGRVGLRAAEAPSPAAEEVRLLLRGRWVDPSLHARGLRRQAAPERAKRLTIRPFDGPREAALAPDPVHGWSLLALGAFALLPAGYGSYLLRKGLRKA